MAEHSWRQPALAMGRLKPRGAPRPFASAFFRSWWPAVLWGCLIFYLSTDTFSSEHTGTVLYGVFHWLVPSLTSAQFAPIHHLIRKSAHFTEYFVFCVLLFRGARSERDGWRWTWALAALSIAAGYSALDELHQAFVASRTASPWDSLLDSAGAFAASIALFVWYRLCSSEQVPEARTELTSR